MLSAKQGSIKYHFFSLWYDSSWDWTQVSGTIGEHSNHYANPTKSLYLSLSLYIYIYMCVCVCVCVCVQDTFKR